MGTSVGAERTRNRPQAPRRRGFLHRSAATRRAVRRAAREPAGHEPHPCSSPVTSPSSTSCCGSAAAAGVTPEVAARRGRRAALAGGARRWCCSVPTSPHEVARPAPVRRARCPCRRAGAGCPTTCSGPRSASAPRTSPSCPRSGGLAGRVAHRPRRRAGTARPGGRRRRRLRRGRSDHLRLRARPGRRAHRGRRWWSTPTRSGPGVDRVLGLEDHDGFRWDALCQTTGRLSARALREALPRRGRPRRR